VLAEVTQVADFALKMSNIGKFLLKLGNL